MIGKLTKEKINSENKYRKSIIPIDNKEYKKMIEQERRNILYNIFDWVNLKLIDEAKKI